MDREFVNLGLSVKWATMNIGAGKIIDPGSYFASRVTGYLYMYVKAFNKFVKVRGYNVANLHFKEQGQTFVQKLKRVLIAEGP